MQKICLSDPRVLVQARPGPDAVELLSPQPEKFLQIAQPLFLSGSTTKTVTASTYQNDTYTLSAFPTITAQQVVMFEAMSVYIAPNDASNKLKLIDVALQLGDQASEIAVHSNQSLPLVLDGVNNINLVYRFNGVPPFPLLYPTSKASTWGLTRSGPGVAISCQNTDSSNHSYIVGLAYTLRIIDAADTSAGRIVQQ